MTVRELANGTCSYFSYDNALRLSEIKHCASDGSALVYFTYDRDAAGDITTMQRENNMTHYYEYDSVKRLTSEVIRDSGGAQLYAFSYDHDAAGNRIYADLDGVETYYTYDAANAITLKHELGVGDSYYGYDANGSLTVLQTPSGTTYYEYGDHGLCTTIIPPTGDSAYFDYDGRLTRYHIKEGSTSTYFTWDGLNILELIENGIKTVLTNGATLVAGVGNVVEINVGGTRYFFHMDQRGTVYKVTDINGSEVWNGLVDALGRELSSSGTPPSIFWYQGQAWYRIVVGGRVYYVSPTRIYDVEDGRFLQKDRLKMSARGYQYCSSGIVSSADANGLEPFPLDPNTPPPRPGTIERNADGEAIRMYQTRGVMERDATGRWYYRPYYQHIPIFEREDFTGRAVTPIPVEIEQPPLFEEPDPAFIDTMLAGNAGVGPLPLPPLGGADVVRVVPTQPLPGLPRADSPLPPPEGERWQDTFFRYMNRTQGILRLRAYHPAHEGQPCCGEPAKLKTFKREDLPARNRVLWMRISYEFEGTYGAAQIRWETCWRPDGRAAVIRACDDKTECALAGIRGFAAWSTGPHITRTWIRYLSCENGIWVVRQARINMTYHYERGKWTPVPARRDEW